MIGVKITGLKEIASNSVEISRYIEDQIEKAMTENMKEAVIKSKDLAPYDQGTLKDSIKYNVDKKSNGSVIGVWGSDLSYAAVNELGGVAEHTATSKKTGNSWKVRSYYRAPKPYLMPVLIKGIDAFLYRFKIAYQNIKSYK